jgi:hypothetical protein
MMRESDLRPVLLVKAIEETQADATLLPPADRLAASREAKDAAPPGRPLRLEGGVLPHQAERLLADRARRLLRQLQARHPFIEEIAEFSPGAWLWGALCLAAFAIGLALSALDGSQRINVLAFPLWGVVLWNLLVYVAVIAAWMRALAGRRRVRRWIPEWIAHGVMGRITSIIARARRFHAPLAQALTRFAGEWREAARPIIAARASAMFHGAAALLGAGLIAGFYLRGIVFDYRAGWESTFLDANAARDVLRVLYGPASAITGIAIPDAAHLEAIRWRPGGGGESAARWIHLLAATALVFVVLPRALLAIAAAVLAAHGARSVRLPASLAPYFDRVFREAGVTLEGGGMRVVPYAHEPDAGAIEKLRAMFPDTALDVATTVAYGNEESVAAMAGGATAPAALALLFTSAATPEEDSHGRAIDAAREAARSRDVRIEAIVDEGPYVARMGPELASRVEERRRAWSRLAAAHGIEARFVDLSK